MAFYVGQKVVCIDDDWSKSTLPNYERIPKPCKGQVYTINEIVEEEKTWLMFVEIDTEAVTGLVTGFASYHFRPVVERKTDISVFEAMLKPARVEA